jgi:hypothetical protein
VQWNGEPFINKTIETIIISTSPMPFVGVTGNDDDDLHKDSVGAFEGPKRLRAPRGH